MGTAGDKWEDRWPVAVLVVSISVCLSIAVLDAASPGPSTDYVIRIVLPEAAPPAIRGGGSPAPDYDLANPYGTRGEAGTGGSALETVRLVRINGLEAGTASIRVSPGSALSIEASALARLLERAGERDLARLIAGSVGSPQFIGFDELGRQGLDVRYDPDTDRILITV